MSRRSQLLDLVRVRLLLAVSKRDDRAFLRASEVLRRSATKRTRRVRSRSDASAARNGDYFPTDSYEG